MGVAVEDGIGVGVVSSSVAVTSLAAMSVAGCTTKTINTQHRAARKAAANKRLMSKINVRSEFFSSTLHPLDK